MTRKDYILIAEALRVCRQDYRIAEPNDLSRAQLGGIESASERIANVLASDNPRFDREHFLAVVRGEKGLNSRPARKGSKIESDPSNPQRAVHDNEENYWEET